MLQEWIIPPDFFKQTKLRAFRKTVFNFVLPFIMCANYTAQSDYAQVPCEGRLFNSTKDRTKEKIKYRYGMRNTEKVQF